MLCNNETVNQKLSRHSIGIECYLLQNSAGSLDIFLRWPSSCVRMDFIGSLRKFVITTCIWVTWTRPFFTRHNFIFKGSIMRNCWSPPSHNLHIQGSNKLFNKLWVSIKDLHSSVRFCLLTSVRVDLSAALPENNLGCRMHSVQAVPTSRSRSWPWWSQTNHRTSSSTESKMLGVENQ